MTKGVESNKKSCETHRMSFLGGGESSAEGKNSPPPSGSEGGGLFNFQEILKRGVEGGASDIHFKVGLPPIVRVNDELRVLSRKFPPFTADDIQGFCTLLAPSHLQVGLVEGHEIDVAYSIPQVGRFRLNLFRSRGAYAIVARYIPFAIRNLDDLGLPLVLKRLAQQNRGLILVTGNTGSGKSTTLAAIINEWNQNRGGHIITVEDPIEYVFRDKRSIVTQREVGIDTESFGSGLKSALRQDPDVIMIGELRDKETVQTALNAAETGHLVLSTLHTKDALETLNRVLSVFDPSVQREVRIQFASSLIAIVSQRLVPKKDGTLTAAVEILLNTPRVKSCLLDSTKTDQLIDAMEQGVETYGSQSFDQHLMQLLKTGVIAKEVAVQNASNPGDFELKLRGISTSSDGRWGRAQSQPQNENKLARSKEISKEKNLEKLAMVDDTQNDPVTTLGTHTGMTESIQGLELDLGAASFPLPSPKPQNPNVPSTPAMNVAKSTKPLVAANNPFAPKKKP